LQLKAFVPPAKDERVLRTGRAREEEEEVKSLSRVRSHVICGEKAL